MKRPAYILLLLWGFLTMSCSDPQPVAERYEQATYALTRGDTAQAIARLEAALKAADSLHLDADDPHYRAVMTELAPLINLHYDFHEAYRAEHRQLLQQRLAFRHILLGLAGIMAVVLAVILIIRRRPALPSPRKAHPEDTTTPPQHASAKEDALADGAKAEKRQELDGHILLLRQKAAAHRPATDEELATLHTLFAALHPQFLPAFRRTLPAASLTDEHIALLALCNFTGQESASLLDCERQDISRHRLRMMHTLTPSSPTSRAADFRAALAGIKERTAKSGGE